MTSPDIHRPTEPLSPEERAIGERLARLGPHGEPSPAVDARILAAAHEAARAPAQTKRSAPRWPVALGIAASLTLAIGIAWQLRPMHEATVYDEAASARPARSEGVAVPQESAADPAAADQVHAVAVQPRPAVETDTTAAPAASARRASDGSPPVPSAATQPARAPTPAPSPPPEPEVVFEDAAAADGAIPPPPAAPPAAPMRAPLPGSAAKAITGQTRTQATERSNEAAAATSADQAAQSREDAFAEDVPPATADSPAVREAWLQRIRELQEAGNTVDARASLDEFVHRYPGHPLPDDLRALLE